MKFIRENGITKTALIIICLISISFFTAYILGQGVRALNTFCLANTPYLACGNTDKFFGGIGGTLIAMVLPIPLFKYLQKMAMWKLALITAMSIMASIIGTLVLKKRYEQSLKTE